MLKVGTMTFKGDLETLNLPDILQVLSTARKTGALSIRRGPEEKRLYFQDGMLVFASSTDEREKLGSVLVREGLLSDDQIEHVRKAQTLTGRRFGLSVIEQGFIPHDKLIAGLKTQAKMIITHLFQWWGGEFEFVEENIAWPEGISVGFDVQGIIMDAATAVDDWNQIKSLLPDLEVILEIAPAPASGEAEVRFDEKEWHVISLVNGNRSAADIAGQSNLSDIEACNIICRLLERGVVRKKGLKAKGPASPVPESSGVAALLNVYNELFAQIYFAVVEEAGPLGAGKLNDAMTARAAEVAPFLKDCWLKATGTFNREAVVNRLMMEDPETREELLAAAIFKLFRDEIEVTASLLPRPKQAALIGDLQPLAALLLKKNDVKTLNTGVRRVLSGFLSPTEVFYARSEER